VGDDISSTVANDAKKAPKPAEASKSKPETKAKVNKKAASPKSIPDVDAAKANTKANAKKADMSVVGEVTKAAKTSKTASNNQETTNKGPVPSKRRRRQPSETATD
jgi:poly(A) polymerase